MLEKVDANHEPAKDWKVGDYLRLCNRPDALYIVDQLNSDGLPIKIHNARTGENGTTFLLDVRALYKVRFEPYDLNDAEVRRSLRGKWITLNNEWEHCINNFSFKYREWFIGSFDAKDLLVNFTFDDGAPVGREIRE